ncbi:hypothetical protein BJ138DRAFT_1101353 [Hygrophoropsis aurantiaca]|uniref:Uncharacterized protein n=1 Tax=Hygrophoropsis aurantiaca TaxID=72124 RepID=A0ACB8ACV3_9AGAM|nr:hypothetical protein BJ138DRAFT_1101353 [Hygrophoropsis aurantiaca]
MTKVATPKSISSSRATPMGSRPLQPPSSPDSLGNSAVGDIATHYGEADAQIDHAMSLDIAEKPEPPTQGNAGTRPTPTEESPSPFLDPIEPDDLDEDPHFANFYLGTGGLHDSMHAPTLTQAAGATSPPHDLPPMITSTRDSSLPNKLSAAEIIRAQLATAGANRALTHPNAMNTTALSAHATPAPEKGFPLVHLASPAQPLHFLSPQILSYWAEEVNEPKCLLRIFDYDGTDASTRASKLAELLRATIISVAPYSIRHKINPNVAAPSAELGREKEGSPEGFLLHQVPEEYINYLLAQRIWSTPSITFEARPFVEDVMPTYLFTLKGLSARADIDVAHIVRTIWSDAVSQHDIESILSYARDISTEGIYEAKVLLLRSVHIERIDYKEKGSVPAPRYNILAISPTSDPEVWTRLRVYLRELPYPSPIDGIGHFEDSFSPCGLCHSVAHPRGLCPFPNVPNWFGGGHTKELARAKDAPAVFRNKGKGKRFN